MALISKIRRSMWIVVVLVALGVGGFILQDMTSGQQSAFGGGQNTLGKVEGEKIEWNEFARTDQIIESVLFQNQGREIYSRRDLLWNYFVEDVLVKQEAEALGLGVSKQELIDLQFGPNPSPVIRQRFADPNTGQVNRQQLNEFQTAIQNNTFTDPTMRAYWAHQEQEIIKDRLQTKLGTLVSKALYTPNWQAEMGFNEQNTRATFAFVRVPFDEIDNSEVALEDADYEAFLEENAEVYRQEEETRRIKYLTLNVFPTSADSAAVREEIAELVPEFETTDNDTTFLQRNFGTMDSKYFKEAELSPVIADTVMRMPVGSVYGPYMEGGEYKAVKVLDRKVIPDSVRSRHILLPAQDQMTYLNAQNTIDSLKQLIETGAQSFDSLALAFGTDATRTEGGDLGYSFPGQMVKPFNDLIFYEAEQDTLYTVLTQFGVHLVEVTGKKFINNDVGVKLAYVAQPIVPSDNTIDDMYDKALEITSNNRTLSALEETANSDPDLSLESSELLTKNAFSIGTLGAGQTSRDIVRWAFSADEGDVSADVYSYQDPVELHVNKYVIVGLETILKAGLPSVEAIKSDIEQLVINQKKGELLTERMQGKDLNALANEFITEVDTAQNISLSVTALPDVGNEPKVVAKAASLPSGQSSEPIIGNSGVFKINVISKSEAGQPGDLTNIRTNLVMSTRSQVLSSLMETLKKDAKITDNRSTFY